MTKLKELIQAATPLPWKTNKHAYATIYAPSGKVVAICESQKRKEDCALIVHCSNHFVALVEAAKHLGTCDYPEEIEHRCEQCVKARHAISLAENVDVEK